MLWYKLFKKLQTEEKTVLLLLTLYIGAHIMELGDLCSVPSPAQSGLKPHSLCPQRMRSPPAGLLEEGRRTRGSMWLSSGYLARRRDVFYLISALCTKGTYCLKN